MSPSMKKVVCGDHVRTVAEELCEVNDLFESRDL